MLESRKDFQWWMPNRYSRAQIVFRNEIDPEQFMRQIDCYITSDNPNELSLIEFAWKNQIEIVSIQRDGLDVFRDFPIDPAIENWKSNLQKIVSEQLLKKFPLGEYEYILAQNGLGESMTLFFLLKEFKRQRRKKVCLLCIDVSRYQMMLRCPYVDQTIRVNREIYQYLSTFYPVKDLLNLHFMHCSICPQDSKNLPQNDEPVMVRYMREFLELDPRTKFSRYPVEIPPENLNRAREIFKSMNLHEGRTIWMNLDAGYYSRLKKYHRDFFIKLGEKFRSSGFDVVTNSPNQEILGIPNVFFEFWDSIAFVKLCRNVVSVPTGWSEANCAFNDSVPIKFHVLFPSVHDQFHNPSPGFFQQIQRHGLHFMDVSMKSYEKLIRNFIPPNVNFELHTFPETEIEEQKFIEELIENISR